MNQTLNTFHSKSVIEGSKKKAKDPPVKKIFEKRYLFVIADGQDILAHDLKFSYVEINERLSKFVPNKTWKSNAA